MPLRTSGVIAIALSLLLAPAAVAAPGHAAPKQAHHKHAHQKRTHHKRVVHKKRHISRHWHGYGFLPGYVPPEVAQRRREEEYRESHPFYGPAWPRFYRGRWNGGGFGPCWTQTPIGYMWNCGK